jgi:hypothetical protein
LANSAALDRLTSLDVSFNNLGDDGIEKLLAKNTALKGLANLDIGDCQASCRFN